MEDPRRRLYWHGLLLFLLGLVTGLVQNLFENPRVGLSAHLEAILNGMFLMLVGAAWPLVRLSAGAARAAFGALLYGAYANWAFVLFAALAGTGALMPIAAPGREAAGWQETLVTAGLGSVVVAMVAGVGLLLWGTRRAAAR